MEPHSARRRALLLAALLPFSAAWRPFDTADGSTTPRGRMVLEWGVVSVDLHGEKTVYALPQLLGRIGLGDQVELGVRGVYRITTAAGHPPWEGHTQAGDVGVYGKWVLLAGSMQEATWVRPSIAVLGGANFLTSTSLWSLDARVAGSMRIGPVHLHTNLGFRQNHHPSVLASALVSVPLSFGLTPSVELSGEVRFGTDPSPASVLMGLSQSFAGLPITVDLAVRKGITPGAPEWQVLSGLSLDYRVFGGR